MLGTLNIGGMSTEEDGDPKLTDEDRDPKLGVDNVSVELSCVFGFFDSGCSGLSICFSELSTCFSLDLSIRFILASLIRIIRYVIYILNTNLLQLLDKFFF